MHLHTLTLLAVLSQDPAADPIQDPLPGATPAVEPAAGDAAAAASAASGVARADVVELRGGELLEGRIVLERSNYVEIELAPGAVVGLRTAEIRSIRRGAGEPLRAAPAGGLVPRDEWFVLHDGDGAAVGWLHAATTATDDGQSRVQEEWEFAQGSRHFQVTMLDVLDPRRGPVSSYFRERVSEEVLGNGPAGAAERTRVVEERIVEARVEGNVLVVQRLTAEGGSSRQLPWPTDGTFPLLARALSLGGEPVGTVTVFDPALEELRTRTIAAVTTRTVPGDAGQPLQVRELAETGPAGRNALWIDASARTLRREIAGPALVAVRSDAQSARGAVAAQQRFASAFVADAAGRFGVWRPNPAWAPVASGSGIVLRCALHDASIAVTTVEHLDAGTSSSAAADAVERWFRLLQPDLALEARDRGTVAGRDAQRLQFGGGTGSGAQRATLWVVPLAPGFLVVRCSAPVAAWAELAADFALVVGHLELEPQAIAALLGGAGAAPGAPAAVLPAAAPVAAPRQPLPLVRVPNDPEPPRR